MTTPYQDAVSAPAHDVSSGVTAAAAREADRMAELTIAQNRLARGEDPATGFPGGYAVAFHAATYSKATTASTVQLDVTKARIGATYSVTVTSSGGGTPVTKTGTVTKTNFAITGVDCHSLTAGTMTATMHLTKDTHQGADATGTAALTS